MARTQTVATFPFSRGPKRTMLEATSGGAQKGPRPARPIGRRPLLLIRRLSRISGGTFGAAAFGIRVPSPELLRLTAPQRI